MQENEIARNSGLQSSLYSRPLSSVAALEAALQSRRNFWSTGMSIEASTSGRTACGGQARAQRAVALHSGAGTVHRRPWARPAVQLRGGAPRRRLTAAAAGPQLRDKTEGGGSADGGPGPGGEPSRPQHTQPPQQQHQQQIESAAGGGGGPSAKLLASLGVLGGLGVLVAGSFLMKDQISLFLDYFIGLVDDLGPLGYVAYMGVYAALELLAVPAIPLTMTAGAIFGLLPGTAVVSVASTAACTGAFLVARYVARDKVREWVARDPRFAAVDRAIGKDGFRVVALLRLSPLLPLAASNYIYGLTSVDLASYVLGSWLGMLPGTFAYVAAGMYGKELLKEGGLEGVGFAPWQLLLAVGVTGLAVFYIGRLAKTALAEVDPDAAAELEERSHEGKE